MTELWLLVQLGRESGNNKTYKFEGAHYGTESNC